MIPQLVALIQLKEGRAKRLLISLLVQLSKAHPQALVYPLTRSTRSATVSRQKAAQEVLNHLRRDNAILVKEADLVSSEMIRVAVLWTEKWMHGIEEASCQYYDMKNIKKVGKDEGCHVDAGDLRRPLQDDRRSLGGGDGSGE